MAKKSRLTFIDQNRPAVIVDPYTPHPYLAWWLKEESPALEQYLKARGYRRQIPDIDFEHEVEVYLPSTNTKKQDKT